MQKTTKKVLLITAVLALVVASVAAFQVLMVATVIGSCGEFDGGIKFDSPGYITGKFLVGNQTFNGTYFDTCISNTTIIEMVCGKNIKPAYANLAAALLETCTINGTTVGKCTSSPNGAFCQ